MEGAGRGAVQSESRGRAAGARGPGRAVGLPAATRGREARASADGRRRRLGAPFGLERPIPTPPLPPPRRDLRRASTPVSPGFALLAPSLVTTPRPSSGFKPGRPHSSLLHTNAQLRPDSKNKTLFHKLTTLRLSASPKRRETARGSAQPVPQP